MKSLYSPSNLSDSTPEKHNQYWPLLSDYMVSFMPSGEVTSELVQMTMKYYKSVISAGHSPASPIIEPDL